MAEDYVWLGPGRVEGEDYDRGDPIDLGGVTDSWILTDYNHVAHKDTPAGQQAIKDKANNDNRVTTAAGEDSGGEASEPNAEPVAGAATVDPDGGVGGEDRASDVNLPLPGNTGGMARGSSMAELAEGGLNLPEDGDPNIAPLPNPPVTQAALGELTAPTASKGAPDSAKVEQGADPVEPSSEGIGGSASTEEDHGEAGSSGGSQSAEGSSNDSGEGSPFASSAAKELAESEGVDPYEVEATGSTGITKKDVEDYVKERDQGDEDDQ